MPSIKPAILCTGPVDESIITSPGYTDADIDVIPFTTISMELPESTQRQIKDILPRKTVVVFTSSNAVRSVAGYMKEKPSGWTIFCMGSLTAKAISFPPFNNNSSAAIFPKLSAWCIAIIFSMFVFLLPSNDRIFPLK